MVVIKLHCCIYILTLFHFVQRVQVEEADVMVQAGEAAQLEAEVDKEMAEATPALEAAVAALDTIKPTDITVVKAMKNPPQAVKTVMEAICIMMGKTPDRKKDPTTLKTYDDYWPASQKFLSDLKFIDSLKNFDKKAIKDEVINKIRKKYVKIYL